MKGRQQQHNPFRLGFRDALLQWKLNHKRYYRGRSRLRHRSQDKSPIDSRLFHPEMDGPILSPPPLHTRGALSSTTTMNSCNDSKHGHVQLIVGPMFSGKTTWMMSRIKTSIMGNKRVCVIVPSMDDRYTRHDMASSHDGLCMRAIKVKSLKDVPAERLNEVDIIGIDEGHFFADLTEFCMTQAERGVDVVVAALKSDAQRNGWKSVDALWPKTDNVICLFAVCVRCGSEKASCSKRIEATNGGGVKQVDVGADDKYVATCSGCWAKEIPNEVLEQRATQVRLAKEMAKEMVE